MSIQQDVQQLVLPTKVELFEIDASAITGSIYRYTPGRDAVVFGGNTFSPYPIDITGLSQDSSQAPARPKLSIGTVDKFFSVLVSQYHDLKGAKVSYFEAFDTYLAAGISSPPHRYIINRKTNDNRTGIVFELISYLDHDRKFLPARQMLKDGPVDEAFPGLGMNRSVS